MRNQRPFRKMWCTHRPDNFLGLLDYLKNPRRKTDRLCHPDHIHHKSFRMDFLNHCCSLGNCRRHLLNIRCFHPSKIVICIILLFINFSDKCINDVNRNNINYASITYQWLILHSFRPRLEWSKWWPSWGWSAGTIFFWVQCTSWYLKSIPSCYVLSITTQKTLTSRTILKDMNHQLNDYPSMHGINIGYENNG